MSKRQQIVDAVKSRFAAISVANGYLTEIGAQQTEWHTTPKEPDQLPGHDIRDETEKAETPETGRNAAILTRYLEFTVIAEIVETTDTAVNARKALADMIKAIGVDQTWNGLARRTLPIEESVLVDGEGQRIGAARLKMQIEYGRRAWDT